MDAAQRDSKCDVLSVAKAAVRQSQTKVTETRQHTAKYTHFSGMLSSKATSEVSL